MKTLTKILKNFALVVCILPTFGVMNDFRVTNFDMKEISKQITTWEEKTGFNGRNGLETIGFNLKDICDN